MQNIAIYGVQAAMGLVGIAAGCAKLAGADVMVDAFELLGMGASFRLLAGSVEILGGLCLLLPRAGVIGAVLMASVVVGTAGVAIGQVASHVLPNVATGVVTTQKAVHSGKFNTLRPVMNYKDGIDI